MTAEIAILNKSAVALAADSAVTISAGSKQEKIFNTADKLFELSDQNSIGIMIYNEMSFMEAPLPSLIKTFRRKCRRVAHVRDAATQFLHFLNEFGKACGQDIKERHIEGLISPIIEQIRDDIGMSMRNLVFDDNIIAENMREESEKAVEIIISDLETAVSKAQPALFFGNSCFVFSDKLVEKISQMVSKRLTIGAELQARVVELLRKNLFGDVLSFGLTGLVIAGFGDDDIFPTLISFEIDGMVCNHLKHVKTHFVDIDRNFDESSSKDKAKILPFAQREMVDRFLYGIDDDGQKTIRKFSRIAIKDIRKGLSKKYTFENPADAQNFADDMQELENVFVDALTNKAVGGIKEKSRKQIEDMVEFMPKPELADMAEALVELTSIKRKVSRGMETVGGPIDVAIISRSEGFVWIKRKQYFPRDLNPRYHARLARAIPPQEESRYGEEPQPERPSEGGTGATRTK